MGQGAGQDDVVRVHAGAADRNADKTTGHGQRGRGGDCIDRRVLGGGHGDAVAALGPEPVVEEIGQRAVGADDIGLDVAGDGVARQRNADRHRNAGRAEAGGQRGRAGQGVDGRGVGGGDRNAVGHDARNSASAAAAVAIDASLEVDTDLVLGPDARAGRTDARAARGTHGHRAGQHDRVDGLACLCVQAQRSGGIDGTVLQIGPHLGRRRSDRTRRPADEVLRHRDADAHPDACAAAGTDGQRDRGHRGCDRRGAGRAEGHVGGARQHAVLTVGIGLRQHHVLRHRTGARDGNAGGTADAKRNRGRGGDGIDGVLADTDLAGDAVEFEHIGLAVGRSQRPRVALDQDRQLELVDLLPVGAAIALGTQIDAGGIGAEVGVDLSGIAAAGIAGQQAHGGAELQVLRTRAGGEHRLRRDGAAHRELAEVRRTRLRVDQVAQRHQHGLVEDEVLRDFVRHSRRDVR